MSLFASRNKEEFYFGPSIEAEAPLWFGVSSEFFFLKHFNISLGFGFTPDSYSSIIGRAASNFSGEASYEPLIESLLEKNKAVRLRGEYYFSGRVGFSVGLNSYKYWTEGEASIVDVLELSTGIDFTFLKAILEEKGKELNANCEMEMSILVISGGYTWNLRQDLFLKTTLGFGKIISSDIKLSSDAPNFDSSKIGKNLYTEAEKEITKIIDDYGYSPIISVNLKYLF
jgi:hypothetical protein